MENENQDKNPNNSNWGIILLILLVMGFFSWLSQKLFPKQTKAKTYPKSDLVKLYGVDIKTINKWVHVFCDQNQLPYDTYKRKRKLPEDIYNYIIECLGLPSEETPVMSKFQIITNGDDMLGDEYRAARNTINLETHSDIILPKIYAMFNVFPPKIAQMLQKKVA